MLFRSPAAVVGFGKLTRAVAGWVELGHRLVRGGYSKVLKNGKVRGPGRQVGTVAAHPFVRPAYEASVDAANQAFAETFAAEIKKRS